MSTFSTAFAAARAMLDSHFGVTFSWTPKGRAAVTGLTGRWSPGQVLRNYYPDGSQEIALGVLRAAPSTLPGASIEDTVTIGGEVYAVKEFGNRAPVLELQLERRTQVRLGGDNHVIKR